MGMVSEGMMVVGEETIRVAMEYSEWGLMAVGLWVAWLQV
jgi:hypothetical protein